MGQRGAEKRGGGWDDVGDGGIGFWKQCGGRVDQRADDFGVKQGGGSQGFLVVEHPSREEGFGCLLDPLVDQRGIFLAQVRRG